MNRREFFATITAAIVGATRWQKIRHWFWPELEDIGISLRYVSQYDIQTDRLICRLDVLSGFSTVRQDAFALLWELQQQHNLELNLTAESLEMAPARQALVFHKDAFVLECAPADWEPLERAA